MSISPASSILRLDAHLRRRCVLILVRVRTVDRRLNPQLRNIRKGTKVSGGAVELWRPCAILAGRLARAARKPRVSNGRYMRQTCSTLDRRTLPFFPFDPVRAADGAGVSICSTLARLVLGFFPEPSAVGLGGSGATELAPQPILPHRAGTQRNPRASSGAQDELG